MGPPGREGGQALSERSEGSLWLGETHSPHLSLWTGCVLAAALQAYLAASLQGLLVPPAAWGTG